MSSVAKRFPLQDTMAAAAAALARLHAAVKCMSAPRMGQTLAALVSVMELAHKSWGEENATVSTNQQDGCHS